MLKLNKGTGLVGLVLALFLILSFAYRPQDTPYDLEVEDLVFPGKHSLRFYPSAVSLIYRYSDSAVHQILADRGIPDYNAFITKSFLPTDSIVPEHLPCRTSRIYYLSEDEAEDYLELFDENNIYINGFSFRKDRDFYVLTRTITVKLVDGLVYQPIIDSIDQAYPMKFRGSIFGRPYYFNWEVQVYSPMDLIDIAKALNEERYIESVQIQMYPCEEPDLRE